MASAITPEIIEIVASMQAKALAFDSDHPGHPLGTRSAAEYAAAIRALVPEQEQLQVGAHDARGRRAGNGPAVALPRRHAPGELGRH